MTRFGLNAPDRYYTHSVASLVAYLFCQLDAQVAQYERTGGVFRISAFLLLLVYPTLTAALVRFFVCRSVDGQLCVPSALYHVISYTSAVPTQISVFSSRSTCFAK